MIGVLVGDLGNAYHAHLAQVVERALFRRGHTAMFCNIEGDEELAIAGSTPCSSSAWPGSCSSR